MSTLLKEAAVLRAAAVRLEIAAEDAPRSAKDLLNRFGPPVMCYRQNIELELANEPSFIQHAIKSAGVALGIEIGGKLRATFSNLTPAADFPPRGRNAIYEAKVYVLTPAEIEDLLQKAFRAGRESL